SASTLEASEPWLRSTASPAGPNGRCPRPPDSNAAGGAASDGAGAGETLAARILFVSNGLCGHVEPLLRLAEEVASRGYDVTFATHDVAAPLVEMTPRVRFLSAGAMPQTPKALQETVRAIG
ncbi:unnamed protein product, partial [Phaeothamnion confervicola]